MWTPVSADRAAITATIPARGSMSVMSRSKPTTTLMGSVCLQAGSVARMPARAVAADGAAPRSLADELRSRSDDQLVALLEARPDLAGPIPSMIGALAQRAASAPSVARALDHLDRFHLDVLEGLAALPEPCAWPDLAAALGVPAKGKAAQPVRAALARLHTLALVWGGDQGLRFASGVREVLGPHPAGLGPALAATHGEVARWADDPEALAALLAEAPAEARSVLDRLVAGPPVGTVQGADRPLTPATARTPVEWLLARALLVPVGPSTVVLPREVGLALRGGVVVRPSPQPAWSTAREHGEAAVDRAAGGLAYAFTRLVADLLEAWSLDGPPVLRAGGLGVRDLKRTAALLDITEAEAALAAEIAYAAGLLGRSDDLDALWLPSPGYDIWAAKDTAGRWLVLAEAWRATTRAAALVGLRDSKDKPIAALGPEAESAAAPDTRALVLDLLAGLPPGGSADAAGLRAAAAWRRPRRSPAARDLFVDAAGSEAEALGVTGFGALSTHGRLLAAGDGPAAAAALAAVLPQPVDHVLLQADLTAVAPGPLEPDLARELGLLADVESTGGATVYRFSDRSVRRALDAGRSAAEVQAFLERTSRTPVPQALHYLVEDVGRRHGQVRVGSAQTYIRSDDVGALAALAADRRAAPLRLRQLAPTVLVSPAPPASVLETLRDTGLAPVGESAEGDVVIRRPDARRSPPRQRPPRAALDAPAPGETALRAAVRAMRAGERAARAPRRGGVVGPAGSLDHVPRLATAQTIALLTALASAGRPAWIGYVDTHGGVSERVVDPVLVQGGWLTAYDHAKGDVHTFAIHRITGAAALEDDGGAA